MLCYLTAPSHYLNQCWLTINRIQWHSSDGNFTGHFIVTISVHNHFFKTPVTISHGKNRLNSHYKYILVTWNVVCIHSARHKTNGYVYVMYRRWARYQTIGTVFQITNNSPVCSAVSRVNDKEKLNVCMTGPISGEPNNTPVCRKLFSTIPYGEPVHLPPQGQWLGPVNCKLIYIYNINAVFLFCNSNILSHIKHTLHNFQHEYCCLRIRSLILVLSELTCKTCGTS